MSATHPKWEPRTREDRMLQSYLRRVRSGGWLGAVHVEVPFGRPSGGTARRLDAVRFPNNDNRIRRYREDAFLADLPGGAPIELIEVKPKLNRTVIGQHVAAGRLVRREWELPKRRPLRLVAVVAEVDAALAIVCEELRIAVERVGNGWPTPCGRSVPRPTVLHEPEPHLITEELDVRYDTQCAPEPEVFLRSDDEPSNLAGRIEVLHIAHVA